MGISDKAGKVSCRDFRSLKRFLKPQFISSRRSTVTNAFVKALAKHDGWDEDAVRAALLDLGQDLFALTCVYCGAPAATWDHVHATVQARRYSGYGDRIRNLVPACRNCNEKKGSKPWREWLVSSGNATDERVAALERHQACLVRDVTQDSPAMEKFYKVLEEVMVLMRHGDELAAQLRQTSASVPLTPSSVSQPPEGGSSNG